MTIIRELVTVLGFQTDAAGIAVAEKAFAGLLKLATGVVASATAVGTGLFKLAHDAEVAGSKIDDMANRLGITTDAMQELAYAARLTGSNNINDLQTALRQLSLTAAKAARGETSAAETFQRLGVSVVGTNGKLRNTPELLGAVADKLSVMEESGKVAENAVKLLGRGGLNLVPLLKTGSKGIAELAREAHDLGLVMSNESVQAAAKFGEESDRARFSILALRNALGTKLFLVLTRLLVWGRMWLTQNRRLIEERLIQYIEYLTKRAEILWDVLSRGARGLQVLTSVFGGLGNVLTVVSGLVGVFAITQLGKLVVSLVRVGAAAQLSTVAFFAWGLAFFALAAFIYAVWDEVDVYLRGGQTLIGLLAKSFLNDDAKPEDHWMVLILKEVVRLAREAWHLISLTAAVSNSLYQNAFGGAGEQRQALADVQEAWANLQADEGAGPKSPEARAARAANAAALANPQSLQSGNADIFEQRSARRGADGGAQSLPPINVTIDARGANPAEVKEAARAGVEDGVKAAIKAQWASQSRSALESLQSVPVE